MQIDYMKIADACRYYECVGYKYFPVPWVVIDYFNDITRPPGNAQIYIHNMRPFSPYGQTLVGSAEQGFLSVYKELLPNTKYYSVTPCFRNEENYSNLVRPYFMKLELFIKEPTCALDWYFLQQKACNFFRQYAEVEIDEINKNQIDLLVNGIEVGSYGYRKFDNMK